MAVQHQPIPCSEFGDFSPRGVLDFATLVCDRLELVIGGKAQRVTLARTNPQNWFRAAEPETIFRGREALAIYKATVQLSHQITRLASALRCQYPPAAPDAW